MKKALTLLAVLFVFSLGWITSVSAQVTPPSAAPIMSFFANSNNPTLSNTGSPQAAVLKVGFVWSQAIPDGTIEVLLRAADDSNNDGAGDILAYDFGAYNPQNGIPVQCPLNMPGYTYNNNGYGVSEADAVVIDGYHYHRFTCSYTGTGQIGTDISSNPMIIGSTLASLINPRASELHLNQLNQINWGEAPPALVRLLDSNNTIIVEREIIPSLNLSGISTNARVLPELSFRITGVSKNNNVCGLVTTDSTTPTAVNFAQVVPNAFSAAAQRLEVISSAPGGYVITTIQSDQLKLNGFSSSCAGVDGLDNRSCIQDATANNMSPTQTAAWTRATDHGFAYTLEPVNTNSNNSAVVFNYTQGFRQFADRQDGEKPILIANNTSTTNQDFYYVCYRLSVDPKNYFGTYQNSLSYTLTATF